MTIPVWFTRAVVGILVTAGLLLPAGCIETTWVSSPAYQRRSKAPARTLVVVYSRTGSTMGAAKEVARFFDADLVQIKAPQYGLTFKGQMLASKHANQEMTTTPIQHAPVDLSRYELVILCAPTWWYRPAVPLWSFVEKHTFAGRAVFLLMTGNSRLKDKLTDKIGVLLERQKGRYVGKYFVRRGRTNFQISPAEANRRVRKALETRRHLWPASAGHRPVPRKP